MKVFMTDIVDQANENAAFRRVLFTGAYMQLVVMTLKPGEDIGFEVHSTTDQFFHIQEGKARIELEDRAMELDENSVIVIPAGTKHNVVNRSSHKDLKLYTIYAPPQHPKETLQMTKREEAGAHK